MKRDLTSKQFGSGKAGAEDTEKRHTVKLARGGKGAMFSEKQAAPAVAGRTAAPNSHGPGGHFGEGGIMPGRSAPSNAVPAQSGRTGNPREPIGKRSPTRDYGKKR
jgi:hypothetical protein